MPTSSEVTLFLGWCTAINGGLLIVSALGLCFLREMIQGLHSKLTGVPQDRLPELYFDYMAKFKILWIIFNFVPWVVLSCGMQVGS